MSDMKEFTSRVAVLILTYNEEENIGRVLSSLGVFKEIVVLDSGSTDSTVDIAARFENVRILERQFDAHSSQWNFGLTCAGIERPWILALDADYVLSGELLEEISRISDEEEVGGYEVGFRYCVSGHPLRGTLYPPKVVLYRRLSAQYFQHGHTQRVFVSGAIRRLSGRIDHDDRKPLGRWLASQCNYARLEADHIHRSEPETLRAVDRIRRTGWAAPICVFFYTLIVKRCLFDGWMGWYYVLQRTLAELIIALEILDRRRIGADANLDWASNDRI